MKEKWKMENGKRKREKERWNDGMMQGGMVERWKDGKRKSEKERWKDEMMERSNNGNGSKR